MASGLFSRAVAPGGKSRMTAFASEVRPPLANSLMAVRRHGGPDFGASSVMTSYPGTPDGGKSVTSLVCARTGSPFRVGESLMTSLPGLGIQPRYIPTAGEYGPSPLLNDVDPISDFGDEFFLEWISIPPGLRIWANDDGSFEVSAANGGPLPDGIHIANVRTWKNGLPLTGNVSGLGGGVSQLAIIVGANSIKSITCNAAIIEQIKSDAEGSAITTQPPVGIWRIRGLEFDVKFSGKF